MLLPFSGWCSPNRVAGSGVLTRNLPAAAGSGNRLFEKQQNFGLIR
jgi:hypothetical protein